MAEDTGNGSARMKNLEDRHERLVTKVDGMSRELERVSTLQTTWENTTCKWHGGDIHEMKGAIRVLEKKVDNRWPTLIASFIGAIVPSASLVILFFKFVMPAIEASSKMHGG